MQHAIGETGVGPGPVIQETSQFRLEFVHRGIAFGFVNAKAPDRDLVKRGGDWAAGLPTVSRSRRGGGMTGDIGL
jgi:hypothetical protein